MYVSVFHEKVRRGGIFILNSQATSYLFRYVMLTKAILSKRKVNHCTIEKHVPILPNRGESVSHTEPEIFEQSVKWRGVYEVCTEVCVLDMGHVRVRRCFVVVVCGSYARRGGVCIRHGKMMVVMMMMSSRVLVVVVWLVMILMMVRISAFW